MFPINSYKEAKFMIKKWCNDFFWWIDIKNSWIKTNDRPYKNANFIDFYELNKTINTIYDNWWNFNLVLNSFEYEIKDYSIILELINKFENKNFNLIIKDFKLIDYINNNCNKKNIHISTINSVINYEWIVFFQNNFKNIIRVCSERDINYYDIEEIINQIIINKNKIEFEIIASSMWCGFSEWSCKLHWISNCKIMKTNLETIKWNSTCSLCILKLLYDKFYEYNYNIYLKISNREWLYKDRLEQYMLLINFIKRLKNNKINSLNEVFIYREKFSDCNKNLCWYF